MLTIIDGAGGKCQAEISAVLVKKPSKVTTTDDDIYKVHFADWYI